jgi:BirA family biotin operon repressor/biotin-[acetyl-CoA-carboxylase] ligase
MTIQILETVGSTNDLAMTAASKGAEHGSCWVAEQQTTGRGRREVGGERREWFSPSGVSIYMSWLLRPNLTPAEASGLTLAAGIGVCEALEGVEGMWLKWPNDIFIGSRKVGGVLTEASTQGQHLDAVVVGLGLNVNLVETEVPEELTTVLTSLRMESSHVWDRLTLVHKLYASVLDWTDRYAQGGYAAIQSGVEKWDKSAGRRVEVIRHTDARTAVAKGIENGALKVRFEDGTEEFVVAGEVKLIP